MFDLAKLLGFVEYVMSLKQQMAVCIDQEVFKRRICCFKVSEADLARFEGRLYHQGNESRVSG